MANLSFKVAYPIIIAGLFVVVIFIALNYRILSITFYVILALLLCYIFLFGFATGQNLAKPVKRLLQRADELSKGDLKTRLYLDGKDEIGELARVFNKIAEELERSKSETVTLKRSVDMKVQARTQALEETINALEQKVRNRAIEFQKMNGDWEKFQWQLKSKEVEVADLRDQILKLKGGVGGRQTKKMSAKKTKIISDSL